MPLIFFYVQIQIAEISTWTIFLENLFSLYGFEKMKNDIMNTWESILNWNKFSLVSCFPDVVKWHLVNLKGCHL